MKQNSREIDSDQDSIHKNLPDLIDRIKKTNFLKPYSDKSLESFSEIKRWVESTKCKRLVLDLCCGVGESSYNLAIENKDCLVLGIDKSYDRISRNNDFKNKLPDNVLIIRADVIDLLRMLYDYIKESDVIVQKIYLLYPNPYPKQKHLKLRWHGQPIFKYFFLFNCDIELRSNWKLYLEEFLFSATILTDFVGVIECYIPEKMFTPFERKFKNSNHQLYQLILSPLQ